ncbi:MAG: CRISPR-associated RAMP protein Csx7 [Desulfobacteraceae bacterium]|jgi:CRISPR-associated RAMP protein (TIGR02581 family)|nr:CRISPR-associated RAMP protein Csx7 [Desulfobacteraceae bacterium]
MLKKMINNARIDIEIHPKDPMLIKSGLAAVGGVDMAFVRTYREDGKEEPFIPGSSIKGMFRSYAEKICRSLQLQDKPVPVCLPYLDPKDEKDGEKRQASCGLRFEKDKKKETIPSTDLYNLSCPACRLFGSNVFIGRFATSDAYITDEFRQNGQPVFEIRDGVAIDRLTGGAARGAKYNLEVLTRGEFSTTLEIRNFERWQLGLIGLVLRDMEQGLVRAGFGKSRGLGSFNAKIINFQLAYYNQSPKELSGLSRLVSEKEASDYGFFEETDEKGPLLPDLQKEGLRSIYNLTDTWKETLKPAVNDLVKYIETVKWPKNIEDFIAGRN